MNCPNCGAGAGPDQKFCFECGTELGAACANCHAPLPEGARFCGECGTPVETADTHAHHKPSEAASERRLVSVLFADLVGFTATSERRDPEEVRDFLTRYTELASDTIARYGGTVDKFLGDGVMAIWGTPTAFEDDAERAVRAALDLTSDVEALGREFGVPELSMRAGVATGEAAVTVEHGSHGMVAGDLVNTASRLEGAATPGSALVNDATKRATESAISYEDSGTVTLKGKTEEVSVWRPIGVVALRGGAGRVAGLDPPFVGRASELHLIKELFKATTRDGRAHLVSVQGIPGIGKSRLVWEFEKYLDGLADSFYWHQGRSPAYGEGVTFWALGEMVRRRAGIAETDDEATTVRSVSSLVETHIPDEDKTWVTGALHTLLGVGNPPSMDRDELFAAWRQFFQRLATDQPVVMVFEDLQWADLGTIDFVESLLEWSRDYPMFIVTLSRPELLDRRQNWGAGQRGFTGLHIEPLSSSEVQDLLAGMVPGLTDSLANQIIERSEGVPLYAVETIRMLIGEGHLTAKGDAYELVGDVPELAVPETLHALVAARLDTLDPEDRKLLQMGSVLGQTFTVKALAELADLSPGEIETRLEPMVRREILSIEADPRSPERGQYRFVQGVIKEVAYSGIARAERSALHQRVAELMESLGDDELAGVIASHYMDAYKSLNERDRDPSLAEKALSALSSAGNRAIELGSYAQAAGFFEEAMSVATEPSQIASLATEAGWAAHSAALSDHAEEYFRTALSVTEDSPHDPVALRATTGLTNVLMMASRITEAIELLETVSEGDKGEESPEWVSVHSQLARAYAFDSQGEKAMELIDKALKEAANLGLGEVLADALVTKGFALGLVDRLLEAAAVTEGALASSERHGFHAVAARARNNIVSYLGWSEPAWSLEVARVGYEQADRLGDLESKGGIGGKVVWLAQEVGDFELAQSVIDELQESAISPFAYMQLIDRLAHQAAYKGDFEAAHKHLAASFADKETSSSVQDHVGAFVAKSQAALLEGDLVKAVAAARDLINLGLRLFEPSSIAIALQPAVEARDKKFITELLQMAEDHGHVSDRFQAALEVGRAGLAAIESRTDEALKRYQTGTDMHRRLGLPLDLARAHLDRLVLLGPDHDGAAEAAQEAREIWTSAGVVPYL
ncbi:MAG: adenylate/guanylate cyclase domain-containing protein, partial [Acidimicrobiia bacterium]|nr:adenylate/guanylate cyclase domain-containing protein [Acidimicrobiia bacterium]